MTMSLATECYPYQKMELRGALAMLYRQILTGESLGGELLCEGRAGTSKTTSILSYLVQACYAWPGCKVLLCRDTRTSLTESVMATLEDEVLGPDHPACQGADRGNRTHYNLGNSRIVCGGLDKPERLFSTAWDLIYFAEAVEATSDAWELFGRSQRPRRKGLTVTPYRQRIADTNPSNPGHWLNKRATPAYDDVRASGSKSQYKAMQRFNAASRCTTDHPMRRLITCHQDNPGYWDMDTWDWTPAGREMMAGLEGMSGHNRARMLNGLWQAASGSVFPEFSEAVHVVDDFEPPMDWPWLVGWDPGRDHPTGIVWLTVAPNGDIFVGDEVKRAGELPSTHVDRIRRMLGKRWVRRWYGDPHGFFSDRAEGDSIATQVRRLGMPGFLPWANNKKDAMIYNLAQRLKNTLENEPGKFYVMRSCKETINEFQSWSYKRNASGEQLKGDDQYEDANNDILDGIIGIVGLNPRFGATSLVSGKDDVVKWITPM